MCIGLSRPVDTLPKCTCTSSLSYRLVFQMGRKKEKKSPKKKEHKPSSHFGQQIGRFSAAQMEKCLAEIERYKKRQQEQGLPRMEKSMNEIARQHGLSPATVNKRVTGKVRGMGSQLGGVRRGSIYSAGKFQAIWDQLEACSLCSCALAFQYEQTLPK